MRVLLILFLLLACGFLLLRWAVPPNATVASAAEGRLATKPTASADVWRRTISGWERSDIWFHESYEPVPHPALVAALELMLSLMALIACHRSAAR